MSKRKFRISNPQTLINEWFYIHGILYTITDFRWDGGWESGLFKGYLTTNIYPLFSRSRQQPLKVEIFFFMDTIQNTIKFNTDVNPNEDVEVSISADFLRNKEEFKLLLHKGIVKLTLENSAFAAAVESSRDYAGVVPTP